MSSYWNYGQNRGQQRYNEDVGNYDYDRYGGTQYGQAGDWDYADYDDRSYYGYDWTAPGDYSYEEWQVSGPYTGYGPQNYTRPDDRIRDDVNDRLWQHGQLDARNISVQVQDGEVTLDGTVDSRHAKRMAEYTADSVPGVRDVHNHLHVDKHLREYEQQNQQQNQQNQ